MPRCGQWRGWTCRLSVTKQRLRTKTRGTVAAHPLLAALLQQLRHQSRPTSLVTGSQSCPRFTMKVLVKQDQVIPTWIGMEWLAGPMHRPAAAVVLQKKPRHPPRDLGRHFPKRHHLAGAGGAFHLILVPQVMVELLQRFDDQVVHRSAAEVPPLPGGRV